MNLYIDSFFIRNQNTLKICSSVSYTGFVAQSWWKGQSWNGNTSSGPILSYGRNFDAILAPSLHWFRFIPVIINIYFGKLIKSEKNISYKNSVQYDLNISKSIGLLHTDCSYDLLIAKIFSIWEATNSFFEKRFEATSSIVKISSISTKESLFLSTYVNYDLYKLSLIKSLSCTSFANSSIFSLDM